MLIEIILFALALWLIYTTTRKPSDLPPGGFGFPLVGSVPRGNFSQYVQRKRKKYGDTFCMKFGCRVMVCISDFETIKAAFSNTEMTGRPDFYTFKYFYYYLNVGLLTSEGKPWVNGRRFALRNLKDLGLGKSRMEDVIMNEAANLKEHLKKSAGKVIQLDWSLNVAVLNVIWQLIADKRFEVDDPEIHSFSHRISTDLQTISGLAILLDFFPVLNAVLPKFVKNRFMKISELEDHRETCYSYFMEIIKDHEKTLNRDSPRDYIDLYLMEIENTKDDPNSTFRSDLLDIFAHIADIFMAGSETTSSTLRWIFLYMAKYRDVQKRLQDEITSVVPADRMPTLQDRDRLPYLDAVLHEIQRCINLVPLGIPHSAVHDTEIEGFRIPRGTAILANIEACHRSKKYWERPDEFYPEHFLDSQGKFIPKKDGFLPFSYGRRLCLGESLARKEVFLFSAALLRSFAVEGAPGEELSLEARNASNILNWSKPYKVILKERTSVSC